MVKDESREYRKPKDLRKGDIVFMRIPFEENTSDYYNGYRPKEIRGNLFRDRNGDSSKPRFVIVIGKDDRQLIYLPLTSRHARFDSEHQYMLQDNSMTYRKDPDMKSYVECDALRTVYIKQDWDIQYNGRIAENDMANIMSRVGKRELDLSSRRDQRVYVSQNKTEAFEQKLKKNGYTVTDSRMLEKTWQAEDGKTVTKSKWGLVHFHVPLSKEEVTELVAERERKPVDDFTRAVMTITDNQATERADRKSVV